MAPFDGPDDRRAVAPRVVGAHGLPEGPTRPAVKGDQVGRAVVIAVEDDLVAPQGGAGTVPVPTGERAGVDHGRRGRISQLEQNLANRRTIEQAKWKLVESCKITEAEAHERLQKAARDRRKPLIEVAQAVIEHGDLFSK